MLGTLSEFTLAQLLQLFALSEKSGTITIHAGSRRTRILIESDRVTGLGAADFDALVDFLRIEMLPVRLRTALQDLAPRKETPGLSLLVGNLIDPQRWQQYIARHFEQDVYPLLNEEDGAFEITVERCPPAPLKVSASIQQLILEGSRWEAESDALRSEGYHPDGSWQRLPERIHDPASGIEHASWLVWAALGSRATIADVAARIGVPDLVAASAVKELHRTGLLQRGH